jgi:hypothetical protein
MVKRPGPARPGSSAELLSGPGLSGSLAGTRGGEPAGQRLDSGAGQDGGDGPRHRPQTHGRPATGGGGAAHRAGLDQPEDLTPNSGDQAKVLAGGSGAG